MGPTEKEKDIRNELKNIAPTLAELKGKEAPLEIPADYFEALSDELMQQIRREHSNSASSGLIHWRRLWQQLFHTAWRPAYGLALAGIAALLIGVSVWITGETPQNRSEWVLSEEEINQYIDHHIDAFDLNLFVEEGTVGPIGGLPLHPEDSLDKNEVDIYLDELLDEIDLEELL